MVKQRAAPDALLVTLKSRRLIFKLGDEGIYRGFPKLGVPYWGSP